mgnify:FL=1
MFRNKKNSESSEIEELKKEKKKTLGRMLVIVLAAAAVIVTLSIAWFASNTRVRGTGMAVSADIESVVELRSKGSAGIHDDLLKQLMKREDHESWYSVLKNVLDTSQEKYTVNWLLSDESNIGNYSKEQSDWENYWENPNNHRQDQAIEPGSSGTLTFYVVPKKDGDVNLDMQLSLIPYKYDTAVEGNFTEADKYTKDLVSGHILLFLEEKDSSETDTSKANTNLQWLKDGSFSLSIKDAQKGQEYPYTLYWCWPQTFAETMLKEGDSFLTMNSRKPLLSEFKNGEEVRKEIACGENNTYSMVRMPERYFYSNLTKSPLSGGQQELNVISARYNQSSADMAEEQKNAFIDLSSYYNQADQYIGGHANCLRVKLEMQPEM